MNVLFTLNHSCRDCSVICGECRGNVFQTIIYSLQTAVLSDWSIGSPLMLCPQAIDEQVERTDSPGDTMDRVDTHAEVCVISRPHTRKTHRRCAVNATPHTCHFNNVCFPQMCSPAQLRQESEELYATIDEILANSSAAVSFHKSRVLM